MMATVEAVIFRMLVSTVEPAILVIEDEEDLRSILKTFLQLEGYRVVAVRDGFSALDRIRDGLRPGLILLDLLSPWLNGIEFLMELKKLGLSFPTVIVSGAEHD